MSELALSHPDSRRNCCCNLQSSLDSETIHQPGKESFVTARFGCSSFSAWGDVGLAALHPPVLPHGALKSCCTLILTFRRGFGACFRGFGERGDAILSIPDVPADNMKEPITLIPHIAASHPLPPALLALPRLSLWLCSLLRWLVTF